MGGKIAFFAVRPNIDRLFKQKRWTNEVAKLQTKAIVTEKHVQRLEKRILEAQTLHQISIKEHAQALQELAQQTHAHSLITEQGKTAKSVLEEKHMKELEEQKLVLLTVERQLAEAQEKLDNLQAVSPTAEEVNRKDSPICSGRDGTFIVSSW